MDIKDVVVSFACFLGFCVSEVIEVFELILTAFSVVPVIESPELDTFVFLATFDYSYNVGDFWLVFESFLTKCFAFLFGVLVVFWDFVCQFEVFL